MIYETEDGAGVFLRYADSEMRDAHFLRVRVVPGDKFNFDASAYAGRDGSTTAVRGLRGAGCFTPVHGVELEVFVVVLVMLLRWHRRRLVVSRWLARGKTLEGLRIG